MPNHRGVISVCRLWSCSIDIPHRFLPAYISFISRARDVWAPAEGSASVKLHHCWKPSPPVWNPWAFLFGSVSLQPPALFHTTLILFLHLRGQVSQEYAKQVSLWPLHTMYWWVKHICCYCFHSNLLQCRFVPDAELFVAVRNFLLSAQDHGDCPPPHILRAALYLLAVCQNKGKALDVVKEDFIPTSWSLFVETEVSPHSHQPSCRKYFDIGGEQWMSEDCAVHLHSGKLTMKIHRGI